VAFLIESIESFLRASKGSATPIIKTPITHRVGDLKAFKAVYLAYSEKIFGVRINGQKPHQTVAEKISNS
jgi:hypothetical protein